MSGSMAGLGVKAGVQKRGSTPQLAGKAAQSVERGLSDKPSSKGPRRKKRLIQAESKGQMPVPRMGGMGVGAGTRGIF